MSKRRIDPRISAAVLLFAAVGSISPFRYMAIFIAKSLSLHWPN
jgi:hypothetical protein